MSTVKNQLKKYILNECLECNLSEFFEAFEKEFNYEYNKKHYPNYTQRVAEWLKGLPSYINVPFYYSDIRELVKGFKTDVTEKTLNRYEDYFFEIVADILVTEFNKIK